jgi:transposase
MFISIKNTKKTNLICDKGYIRSQKDKKQILNKYNTDIICPNRKNQKEKTSNKHKKLLKKRYVIENVFANLKRFNRICLRKDKLTVTFTGFLFLATIFTFKK